MPAVYAGQPWRCWNGVGKLHKMTVSRGDSLHATTFVPRHSIVERGVVASLRANDAAMAPPGGRSGSHAVLYFPRGWHKRPLGGHAKRAFDLAVAVAMLVVTAPIMLMVAALIRVSMGGPVIFAQRRIGFNGQSFVCYKFRTMASDAEALLERHLASDPEAAREWRETQKLANDPRVGCLGRVLRKSSLDELPQLFNVLRGDMSLVGPRPVVPDELRRYGRYAIVYAKARPGLTGMWQTSGRNRVSYRARVARDRYYVRNWSLWLDFVLLLKTIPAVLKFDQTA